MSFNIKSAISQQEKEAIYRFRYRIFIEEQDKNYLHPDNERKMLYDEADEFATLYYIDDNNGNVIATVRVIGGAESVFPSYAVELFNLNFFGNHFVRREYAISDRIMVDPLYRSHKIGEKLHQASFIKGLEWGTQICFCSCETDVAFMYFNYGWRAFAEPVILPNGRKLYKLALLITDYDYLKRLNSPYLKFLPAQESNAGEIHQRLQKMDVRLLSLLPNTV